MGRVGLFKKTNKKKTKTIQYKDKNRDLSQRKRSWKGGVLRSKWFLALSTTGYVSDNARDFFISGKVSLLPLNIVESTMLMKCLSYIFI